ncbi:protein-tyrosine phosphatase-like protein [Crepidotus variabilis]|uniref:Protein-tyrosine phosphatase-like protein n=1 Tax=Crepidotus variabilis TaxID=179855 RepID=A0A9P6ELV8_9AGAR|nr:protein-tyrosine phosphatase-like protein [Crepidotus variabilis]
MDAIRISKVENVLYSKSGSTSTGTLHLTAHHIIFRYEDSGEKEMWMPYPLISQVNRLPQNLQGDTVVNFQTRTFESSSFSFKKDSDAADVFESVKELTVALSVTQLYAFFYTPNPPFPSDDGWSIYSPRDEYQRMGVGTRSKAWRFTDVNKDYTFCPSYAARLVVPTKISDTTLQYASKYRSKCRIPILSYLHWANFGSITRSSQPMVGITQNRSLQDEKLIEAIFQTHWAPESRVANIQVYGATSTNLIIDARPTVNAVANTAKGAGTENMDYYKDSKKIYLGIDHIHAMRDSLAKVVEALKEADQLLSSINNDLNDRVSGLAVLDRAALRRSGWLRHLTGIMEGTLIIVKNIHINSSHVLIHCSDGWDRTSQLSALAQICLDPFYRTIRGFEILVEKDWVSVGHKFLDRCGHLSSEKFFSSASNDPNTGTGADAAQAFLASVQNRFTSQHHIKETSPTFHQFLECVRQLQRQHPDRFEFKERFLRQLYYHLYSCQFGTFLLNTERERRIGDGNGPPTCERTISVWDFFNSPTEMELNRNSTYDASLDDPKRRTPDGDMGILYPNPKDVRFWNELYGRSDEEMNGRVVAAQSRDAELVGPVESAEDDPVLRRVSTPEASLAISTSPTRGSTVSPPLSHSLNVSIPSHRSASPGIESSFKDLTSSLPDMSRPSPSRSPAPSATNIPSMPRSYSPSSSLSGPASSTSGSSSTNTPASPLWARPRQADFLSGGGVKSVWGRLSSNASAALSLVQDTYSGVAKDLMNPTSAGPSDNETSAERELRGRDSLTTWGEGTSGRSSSATRVASMHLTNPWATSGHGGASHTASRPAISIFDENPWGLSPDPEPHAQVSGASSIQPAVQSASPLPIDPTIPTIPTSVRRPTPSSVKSTSRAISSPSTNIKKDSSTDPLGVGLL